MKKVLALALGMLLIPFTAFGMQSLSDADMDSVTGQSGVAITVDDIVLYSEGADEMWFQVSDSFITNNFAAIGFSGLENETASTTFINAIVSDGGTAANALQGVDGIGKMGLYMDYEGLYDQYLEVTGAQYNHADHIGALTITVSGDLPIFGAALGSVGSPDTVAGVLIGLPSVEIYSQGSEAREIMVSTTVDQTDPGAGVQYRYGTLWSDDGGGLAVLGGAVEIAPLEAYVSETGGSLYNATP